VPCNIRKGIRLLPNREAAIRSVRRPAQAERPRLPIHPRQTRQHTQGRVLQRRTRAMDVRRIKNELEIMQSGGRITKKPTPDMGKNPKEKFQMKLKTAAMLLSVGGVCAGCAVFRPGQSGSEQNIFVGNWYAPGDIYEITPSGEVSKFGSNTGEPEGLAFDKAGDLFVSDSMTGSIDEFTPTGVESVFAQGVGNVDQLTFDRAGDLFVVAHYGGSIYRFKPDGTRTTYASGFSGPYGLAFNARGDLFISDNPAGTIIEIAPDGTQTAFASGLSHPCGLAFDRKGDLFEADSGSGDIYEFTTHGKKVLFASGLVVPCPLAFDRKGDLYVGEQDASRVVRFRPNGNKTILAIGLGHNVALAIQGIELPVSRHP
jgi:sugar lactone lactonase YvrE